MVRAKLIVTLPDDTWIKEVTCEYPDADFRVLAALPAEGSGVGLLEITSEELPSVIASMNESPDVTSIEIIQSLDDEALVQFETTKPLLLLSAQDSGIPLQLPIEIQAGRAAVEVRAPRHRLSSLAQMLESFGMSFEVEYIHESVDPSSFLTEQQQRIVREAVECGYYDTPRGCSLTQLAENIGIAKSTASETLHRAEEKIIKQFFENQFGGVDLPSEPPE
ncbi:helix-turn-helix domain-containing protein [Halobacteriaceae archaeon GCM10025711]